MYLPEPHPPVVPPPPADAARYKSITSQARAYGMTSPAFLKVLDDLGIRSRKGGIPSEEAIRDHIAYQFALHEDAGLGYVTNPDKPRPSTYWKWHADKLRALLETHGVHFVPADKRTAVINEKRFTDAAALLAAHKTLDKLLVSVPADEPSLAGARGTLASFSRAGAELLKYVRRKDDGSGRYDCHETLMDMDHVYYALTRGNTGTSAWIDWPYYREIRRDIRAIAKGALIYAKVVGIFGTWCMTH